MAVILKFLLLAAIVVEITSKVEASFTPPMPETPEETKHEINNAGFLLTAVRILRDLNIYPAYPSLKKNDICEREDTSATKMFGCYAIYLLVSEAKIKIALKLLMDFFLVLWSISSGKAVQKCQDETSYISMSCYKNLITNEYRTAIEEHLEATFNHYNPCKQRDALEMIKCYKKAYAFTLQHDDHCNTCKDCSLYDVLACYEKLTNAKTEAKRRMNGEHNDDHYDACRPLTDHQLTVCYVNKIKMLMSPIVRAAKTVGRTCKNLLKSAKNALGTVIENYPDYEEYLDE